ncbi:MAG: oligoendopeptidase F, partial [Candidatus Sericytochromatia bacterium]|nr:oligoendopeptidase F [Candidatus Sericytochromatia bacterium]
MTAVESSEKTGAELVAWNLGDLFTGADDPQLAATMDAALQEAERFAATHRARIVPGLTAGTLANALHALESIHDRMGRVLSFAYLQFAADTSAPRHGALLQAMQERATAIGRHLLFFDLAWVAIADDEATRLLADPVLARWGYYLQRARVYKPHVLSEPEEAILEEKANTGDRAFTRLFDEVITRMRFHYTGPDGVQDMSQQEVLTRLYDTDRAVREAAATALTAGLQSESHVLTYLFNVLVQDKAVDDRLRDYDDPMLSRHLANQIEPQAVQALIAAVEQNYSLVHRYYALKRQLLGLETLYDYDRYAPIGTAKQMIPFAEGQQIVLDAFGKFSPQMRAITAEFFDKQWIDAALRPGKRGGAFSHSTVPSAHPYILLNYTGRL